MDKNTFGDSSASIILADIIEHHENDGNWKSSVKRRMDKFRGILKGLYSLEKEDYQKFLAQVLYKEFERKTNSNDWPEKVQTYFLNVINADYKEFLRRLESSN